MTAEETGGKYSLHELRVRPRGFVAATHIHPRMEESLETREGAFAFVVNGKERKVAAGEGAPVPPGTPHA